MQHHELQRRESNEQDERTRWRRIVIAALFAVGICAVTAALVIAHADRPARAIGAASAYL